MAVALPSRHPSDLLPEPGVRSGTAVLTVTGLPERASSTPFEVAGSPPRVLFDAELRSFTTGGRQHHLRSPVLVFASAAHPERLALGSEIRVAGRLTSTEPGDSREFLFFARGSPEIVASPPVWLSWADPVRSAFRDAVAGLPGDGRQLLIGLAIGDDRDVSDDLTEAMTVSGLTHLTAVSGANCAIVVGAVVLVGGALGLGRRLRAMLALSVLLMFVVLVTPEPSVLRAATMAVVVLIASLADRPAAGLPPLGASMLVLLVADPWLSRSAGFALSVLATAGLLLFTRPFAAVLARVLPRPLALALAVPIAAQLTCQPVLFLLAPQLTPYTLVANLLAEPAAALVSVLGLITCVLAVVSPRLAEVVVWLPWLPSAWIGAVARFCAGLPLAVLPVVDGLAAALVALALIPLVAFWLTAWRTRRGIVKVTLAAVVAVVVAVIGASAGGVIAQRGSIPHDWTFAACDIGQGDAVLVRDPPSGRVALVDTGPDPEPLAACLDTLAIDRLDLLVLTHYDRDHVGGLDAVLGRASTALVGPPDGSADERMLTALTDAGTEVVPASQDLVGDLGATGWQVLWPPSGTRLRGNDASVTVRFDAPGGVRSLFLGDLGEQAQDALLAQGEVTPVDVVKVAHHGSADQSERLYAALGARLGLISVGADNGYGHPTPSLLALLGRTATTPFRTDLSGLVVVTTHGHDLTVWTERDPATPESLGSVSMSPARTSPRPLRRVDAAPRYHPPTAPLSRPCPRYRARACRIRARVSALARVACARLSPRSPMSRPSPVLPPLHLPVSRRRPRTPASHFDFPTPTPPPRPTRPRLDLHSRRCGAVRGGVGRCGAGRGGAVRCGAGRCGAVRCGAGRGCRRRTVV
ncbi:hypothetical protein GCM10009851_17590 [Herbiconiux moechotypicola]|uniref:Metallo-beta-lactamase domain-containing protein n=1 Tax=Herbiconiux moechotypicola TaxID=637393 RepID=A0ABP5QE21_9MICO